jgi:hypothetical protein
VNICSLTVRHLAWRLGEGADVGRRGSSRRSAALRRAQEAKAGRDSAAAAREQQIEAALADYFEALLEADRVREDARRKADAAISAAEQAVAAPMAAARDAVRRLRELTGSTAEVATLCGLSVAAAREVLASPNGPAGDVPHEPAGGAVS